MEKPCINKVILSYPILVLPPPPTLPLPAPIWLLLISPSSFPHPSPPCTYLTTVDKYLVSSSPRPTKFLPRIPLNRCIEQRQARRSPVRQDPVKRKIRKITVNKTKIFNALTPSDVSHESFSPLFTVGRMNNSHWQFVFDDLLM